MRYSIPILSSILLFLFGCQTIPKQKKATPYNVLFITVDDLRPELGCYGSNLAQSPNIDALAAKSLVFERAYCQAPICSPSRMSFLSGLRPHETDINNNKTHIRRKLPNVVTLPQHFKNLGYQTIGIGKVFHGGLTDTASWHVQSDGPPQRMYNLERNLKINVPKTPPGQKSRRGRPYENADVADGLYTDGMIVNRAVEELDKLDKNQAFFLAVGFLKPHLPFNAPKKYWDLYDAPNRQYEQIKELPQNAPTYASNHSAELRKYHAVPPTGYVAPVLEDSLVHGYLACVSYMDAQVGKLLTTLEKKGVADRTIVVLLGDHGYKFGDFGSWCKDTHYDLDTHVPLIIHHPDLPAARTKSITELIDVYPTLVAATETKTAQDLSGISLLPLFDNPEKSLKKAAFSQRPRKKDKVYGYSVRTDDFRLVKWVDYAVPEKTVNLELYDYRNDPMELVNVANQMEYKVVQATLLEELQGTIER